ncbi:MAG: nitroreductase family protein [Actinobacteria bacterium]|nr:nitroreductase family protein [Actinomycetota bacterium]
MTAAPDRTGPDGRAAPAFDLFWLNSSLNATTRAGFGQRAGAWQPPPPAADRLAVTAAPVALGRPVDAMQQAAEARRSRRAFAEQPLTAESVAALLSGAAGRADGSGRLVGSAGALYPVEVFLLLRRPSPPLERGVHRHLASEHALVEVGPLPEEEVLGDLLDPTGDPGGAAVVVLALHLEAVLDKYGERGGRFALMEVGMTAHALELRAAAAGLAGYLLGGTDDAGLDEVINRGRRPRVHTALAYVVGDPAH